jgi:hypothetical protein
MPRIKHVDGVDIEMTPEEEAEFLASLPGPAKPLVPHVISRRQFFEELADRAIITEADALAALTVGTIPAVMMTLINGMPAKAQFKAKMLLSGATQFERNHPLVEVFAQSQGMVKEDVDDFFIAAAKL